MRSLRWRSRLYWKSYQSSLRITKRSASILLEVTMFTLKYPSIVTQNRSSQIKMTVVG